MKFLTLPEIKAHSRIDLGIEDEILELYASAAEGVVLDTIGYSYEELVAEYGEVPAQIRQAALLLTDVSYTHRSPVSPTNTYNIGCSFDALVKPFIKLTH